MPVQSITLFLNLADSIPGYETPEVLYGDEVADKVELWMKDISMYGEPIYDDQYCFSIERGDPHDLYPTGFSGLMKDSRENYCRLYIVTEASDPIDDDRMGIMMPQCMVYDIRRSDGTCEYGTIDLGSMLTGIISIDHRPFASGLVSGSDKEIVGDWPDPNYRQSPEGMWHDWCPSETTIFWWDLTEILMRPINQLPGKDITDIRIRITDLTPDMRGTDIPPGMLSGYTGNWRRSDNVMEQLCSRSASSTRHAMQYGCRFDLYVEPGIPGDDPNDPELYWIDGPAISIYGSKDQPQNPPVVSDCIDEWDLYTLQHSWLPLDGLCPIGSYIPDYDSMHVGQIRLRLCEGNFPLCCDYAIRIYAVGPDNEIFGIYPDPQDPYEVYINYENEFCGDDCLDPVYEWDITNLPCGNYIIYAEAYDMAIARVCPLSMPVITTESRSLKLDKVKKSDLVRIAPIYEGDRYWSSNHPSYNDINGYRPRNNHHLSTDPTRTVDCTNYLTQLLRRLGRRDWDTHIDPQTGEYPIDSSAASWWNTDRTDEVNHLSDLGWQFLEKGDLVTRDPKKSGRPHHVMIWVRLVDSGLNGFVGPLLPDYYGYSYEEWESTADNDAGVRLHVRNGDCRTHFRQWVNDVVFNNCN
jgi:hypothetical protein